MTDRHPTLLSILICSIPERSEMLAGLLTVLSNQMQSGVEVLVNIDNKDITMGAKENRLLEAAKGKYVVFVDDDDMVKENYIEKILEGIKHDVDIVQIQTDYFVNGVWTALITFKMGQVWEPASETLYLRGCAKFCPHKRDIALQIMFEDINYIEDRPYAAGLDRLIKSEYLIDCPIYEYRYLVNKYGK